MGLLAAESLAWRSSRASRTAMVLVPAAEIEALKEET